MRRTPTSILTSILTVLLLLLAACSRERDAKSPSGKPPDVTLQLQNLTLSTTSPIVVGIDNATPATSIIVTHDPYAHVDVYILESPDTPVPAAGCPVKTTRRDCIRDIGTGVREQLEASSGAGRAVVIALRDGNAAATVRLDYSERSRRIDLRIPSIAPPPSAAACKDNGCNPYLEMIPLRSGGLTAQATFTGGVGKLQVQAGRVIAKSFTATGIPYRIPAEKIGRSSIEITAHVDAQAEYALAISNEDPASPLTGIRLNATWP